MAEDADGDGDGYVDYAGRYARGLVNQGWKDSGNAIVNADGTLAEPPIALCEVQAYAYRAWRQTATLLRRLGEPGRADELEHRAAALRARFNRDFWSDALGCYVLARQAAGRPAAVVASNAGQVLWGGIATAEQAARVVERLMQPDMFSGWGIRTLSAHAAAYNPIGYHLGTVWPHDNSLILAGFRRYRHDAAALEVFDALFDAASLFRGYRLPELYCGHDRRESEDGPIPYPVACRRGRPGACRTRSGTCSASRRTRCGDGSWCVGRGCRAGSRASRSAASTWATRSPTCDSAARTMASGWRRRSSAVGCRWSTPRARRATTAPADRWHRVCRKVPR
jgi:glycogen debranching enzyme